MKELGTVPEVEKMCQATSYEGLYGRLYFISEKIQIELLQHHSVLSAPITKITMQYCKCSSFVQGPYVITVDQDMNIQLYLQIYF